MKKNILITFSLTILLITIQLVLTAHSAGNAFGSNFGATGAPNELQTCMGCHGTGFNTTVSINIKDRNGSPVTSYVPLDIYTIDFVVNSTGAVGYGFQLLALDNSNLPFNGFSNPSTNSQVVTLATGRQYAEHTNTSATNVFSVDWTAPAVGTGDINFFGAGAAVDRNTQTSGDGGNVIKTTLNESSAVGIAETLSSNTISVYPNPTSDILNISHLGKELQPSTVRIIDLVGKVVSEQIIQGNLNQEKSINLGHLKKGIYIIEVTSKSENYSSKIAIN